MANFYPLVIKEKRFETSTCVSLLFDIPEDLKNSFEYTSGQYLTLRADINGEDIRRSYSLCSAPHESQWRVAVKKVPGGRFSTFAMDVLQEGDTLEVMAPAGNFSLKEEGPSYVMIAAGSGITPILSLTKDILEKQPEADVLLFYGNKTSDQIIFKEELEALKNVHLERLQLYYILSQEHQESPWFNGRIDGEKVGQYAKVFFDTQAVTEYFICGPEAMIWSAKEKLEALGVQEDRIRFELFTSSASPAGEAFKGHLQEEELEYESEITIILDGQESQFGLGYQGLTILDAALAQNNDLPFACKGGVCCTCKAKLLEGQVEMEVNYALEPEEVEAGYILTCQSHPRTEKVKVDFDV